MFRWIGSMEPFRGRGLRQGPSWKSLVSGDPKEPESGLEMKLHRSSRNLYLDCLGFKFLVNQVWILMKVRGRKKTVDRPYVSRISQGWDYFRPDSRNGEKFLRFLALAMNTLRIRVSYMISGEKGLWMINKLALNQRKEDHHHGLVKHFRLWIRSWVYSWNDCLLELSISSSNQSFAVYILKVVKLSQLSINGREC